MTSSNKENKEREENKYYKTRQSIPQVFRDPISGYKFVLEYPFKLKNKWAIHPAYNEDFSTSYKNAKEVLLSNEHLYNLETKRLVIGILLYHLSRSKILEFRQFSQLTVSYAFFNDKKFLAKFFFIVPILWRMPAAARRRYPRFRITTGDITDIRYWLDRCIQIFNKIEKYQKENTYDEKFLEINARFSRWKLSSKSPHKLPKPIIRYIFECSQTPPSLRESYEKFFLLSAGELWISHKSRSPESIDLFWTLLEAIDQIELSDYQNTITMWASQWLKHKANEWAAWEPAFDELLLDHRLSYKKKKAIENVYQAWTIEDENRSESRKEINTLSSSVQARLAAIRLKQQASKHDSPLFTIRPSEGEQS